MKKLEFETSRGRFLVVNKDSMAYLRAMWDCDFISKLSEITEEQSSEIVDKKIGYKNYLESNDLISNYSCFTAIESLHSLLKSKGIHLFENPLKNTYSIQSLEGSLKHRNQTNEAEQKTFYNPYIFKL